MPGGIATDQLRCDAEHSTNRSNLPTGATYLPEQGRLLRCYCENILERFHTLQHGAHRLKLLLDTLNLWLHRKHFQTDFDGPTRIVCYGSQR